MAGSQRIGRYQVVRELGRGGMGIVYEVRAGDDPTRLALKLNLKLSPEHVQRFLREARILEVLGQHPNIMPLHDAGHDGGGRSFLVMPLAEGGTLGERVQAGTLTLEQAVRIVIDVARALEFAHTAGIVHRDLKPANVLLDGEGRALVSDFGIARAQLAQSLTKTGQLVGTVSYMAPEQARDAKKVDRRTDVYALGGLLYFVLAGAAPFEGESIRVLARVLTEAPEPPSRVRPGVPPALEGVCLHALAKAPESRQPSAEAFAQELERAWRGEGGPPAPARRRGPLAAVGLGAGVVGMLLGLGLGGVATGSDSVGTAAPAAATSTGAADAAALALLAAGRPLPAGVTDALVAPWAAAAAAQGAINGGDLPRADELLARLPTGAPQTFLRAELALTRGAPEAWPVLEGGAPPELPWAQEAGPAWAARAERLERSGREDAAARAYLRAGTAGGELAAAADWLDRAAALDLGLVLDAGGPAADVLVRGAHADLSARPEVPAAVARARARLVRARVLCPDLDLRESAALLRKVAGEGDAAVRLAARPWTRRIFGPEALDAALAQVEASADLIRTFRPGWLDEQKARPAEATWPRAWRDAFLCVGTSDPRALRYALEEWLLSYPELPFLWNELTILLLGEGRTGVEMGHRLLLEVERRAGGLQDDQWIQLGQSAVWTGRQDDAARAGRRVLEITLRGAAGDPSRTNTWWAYAAACALGHTGDPALAREGLEIVDRTRLLERLEGGRVWSAVAVMRRTAGDEPGAEVAWERARALAASERGW